MLKQSGASGGGFLQRCNHKPQGNRHLMSPAPPGFHTEGLIPLLPSPEAPAHPGRLGSPSHLHSAVYSVLFLILTLLYYIKYNLSGREEPTGEREGELCQGTRHTLLQGVDFRKPVWS